MIWIVLLGFIGILALMVIMVMKQLKKVDSQSEGVVANSSGLGSAQDFLPFENIREGIIDLGGFQYRMIIECSSINYALKTDEEQEIIEMTFQRNLNSFQFPFSFFVQTREIDNTKMLESLAQDSAEAVKDFPILAEYAEDHYNEMRNLTKTLQNTKQKKKYIIVPYDEAAVLTNMSNEEKFDYASKELWARAVMVRDAMGSMGIKAHILSQYEVIELIYNTFHKDGAGDLEGILTGDHLSMLTEGVFRNNKTGDLLIGNRMAHMDPIEKMQLILSHAQMQIKDEVNTQISNLDTLALVDAVLEKISEVKKSSQKAYEMIQDNELAEEIYGGGDR